MAKETEIQALTRQVKDLRTELSKVKELLHTKDNWPAYVRENRGKLIRLTLSDSTALLGTLLWSDRYTICISLETEEPSLIVSKGAIVSIQAWKGG